MTDEQKARIQNQVIDNAIVKIKDLMTKYRVTSKQVNTRLLLAAYIQGMQDALAIKEEEIGDKRS